MITIQVTTYALTDGSEVHDVWLRQGDDRIVIRAVTQGDALTLADAIADHIRLGSVTEVSMR